MFTNKLIDLDFQVNQIKKRQRERERTRHKRARITFMNMIIEKMCVSQMKKKKHYDWIC